MPQSRRTFLKKTLAVGAAIGFPTIIPARALGKDGAVAPSERIALGVIGLGPRCQTVLGCMLEEADVQCTTVCDVQASRLARGKGWVDKKYGNNDCAALRDFRELLARKDIDAVLVATGDRWHAMGSIMAAKAGKDVYSEKPCGITIADCQSLADTMHRYGRVFQAGTQRRSIANYQLAAHLAHTGKLGRLHTLHASIYRLRVRYDWLPEQPEPAKDICDWDTWLGPAPWRPYNAGYVNGGWRTHFDFDSGATLHDWGAHTVDLCQWAAKADDTMPVEYEPTADNITAKYANGVKLVMDFLNSPFGNRDPHYRTRLGTCPVRFEGDEGWVETGDSGDLEVHPASLKSELRQLRRRPDGISPGSHGRNFFDCIRTRGRTNANPEVMRHSHIACHAAALAWMLGRKLTLDPVKEVFVNDEEANRMRSRPAREPFSV
ncbi:MAG TPA: Gfo/Idh/MocA family oxidoreductase [Planctomycetota bacterium]|jgi:hypothetical protein